MESLPHEFESDGSCNVLMEIADVVGRRDEAPVNSVVPLNETIAGHVHVPCHEAPGIGSGDEHIERGESETSYHEDRQLVDTPQGLARQCHPRLDIRRE